MVAYAAAESRAKATPAGRTVPVPPLPSIRTASPASAPVTATAPPVPTRSPSSARPPNATSTGAVPMVRTVPTASPVPATAPKYPAWKTVKPTPVTRTRVTRERVGSYGRDTAGPDRRGRRARTARTTSRSTSPPRVRQKVSARGPSPLLP